MPDMKQRDTLPTTWRCPKCANTITVFTTVTLAPTCSRHTGGPTIMKQVTA